MSKKRYLGMDLGHGVACFALVDPEKGEISSTIQVEWEADKSKFTYQQRLKNEYEAINKVINKIPTANELVLCAAADVIYSRYIELPPLKGSQLETAINTRIRKYFPIVENKHTVTKAEMAPLSGDKKKRGYLVVISKKQTIEDQVTLLRTLEFDIAHIDISQTAITRWLLYEDPGLEKGNHFFAFIERDMIIIGAFRDKLLYMAKYLKPSLIGIPAWKLGKLDSLKTIKPYIEELIVEIESMATYVQFRTIADEMKIDSILIMGKYCKDKLLNSLLKENLDIPVRIMEPKKLKFVEKIDPEKAYQYIVAAGFSLRILEESVWL